MMSSELINIVIDKILLAIVLLCFGYYFNKLLERYKGNLSYRQKLMEMRMNCYQDMASKAMLYYFKVQEFIEFYNKKISTKSLDKEIIMDEVDKLNQVYNNLQTSMSMGYVFLSGQMAERFTSFAEANGLLNDGINNLEIWKTHFGDKKHELFTMNLAKLAHSMAGELHSPLHK